MSAGKTFSTRDSSVAIHRNLSVPRLSARNYLNPFSEIRDEKPRECKISRNSGKKESSLPRATNVTLRGREKKENASEMSRIHGMHDRGNAQFAKSRNYRTIKICVSFFSINKYVRKLANVEVAKITLVNPGGDWLLASADLASLVPWTRSPHLAYDGALFLAIYSTALLPGGVRKTAIFTTFQRLPTRISRILCIFTAPQLLLLLFKDSNRCVNASISVLK